MILSKVKPALTRPRPGAVVEHDRHLWDTEIAGFGLRVYPSGRKAFVVTYRVRGKQRFLTTGRYREMTLYEARGRAHEILGQARKGEDPAANRRSYRRAPTMRDLAERFMTEHARLHNKPNTVKVQQHVWDRHLLPRFGSRKIVDIDRADVQALHTELAETPGMANVVRAQLSKAFNLAEIWEWRPQGSNPRRHVKLYKTRKREPPWKTLLQAHWEGLAAADLFTVEVLTLRGLKRYFVLFVIELKTRQVKIASTHPYPCGEWMERVAQDLTDAVDGFLRNARYLIHDRDPLFTRAFCEILKRNGVKPVKLPPRSPNLNACAERFVRSIKEECLSRVVVLGNVICVS